MTEPHQNDPTARGEHLHGTSCPAETEGAVSSPRRARARPTSADVAVGVGHSRMPEDHIARGLARIATRGIRTAKVTQIRGVPVVMTKDLPEGVIALLLTDRIEARRTETGALVVTLYRTAISEMAGGYPVRAPAEGILPAGGSFAELPFRNEHPSSCQNA